MVRKHIFDALVRAVQEGRSPASVLADVPMLHLVRLLQDNTPSPVTGRVGIATRLEFLERAVEILTDRLNGDGGERSIEDLRATVGRFAAWETVR